MSSPTAAYRADTTERDTPFGPDDDAWLETATELHFAATVAPAARQEHLYSAIGRAIDLLGDERIDLAVRDDWRGERSYVDPLLVLIDQIQDDGALSLAAVMLDDLARAADDLSTVQRGRVLALRARIAWKMGELDDAADRYHYIESLGAEARSDELKARASLGLAVLAQMRGNYPEVRVHAARAAALAEPLQLHTVSRWAHHGLMAAAARSGDYDQALLDGWKALQLSSGDPVHEAEVLQRLGQFLLETGHVAEARACFAATLDRPAPLRVLFPALGGLADASARLGEEATLEWCTREIWRAHSIGISRYEIAAALLDAAAALHRLGRHEESERFRRAGESVAASRGFHELVFRAEDDSAVTPPPTTTVAFRPDADRVLRELAAFEPKRLPVALSFYSLQT